MVISEEKYINCHKIEIIPSPVLSCLHPAGKLTGIYFRYVEETGAFIVSFTAVIRATLIMAAKETRGLHRGEGADTAKYDQVISLPLSCLK